MFYAWNAAADFAVGYLPLAKSQSHNALVDRMRENGRRSFVTAYRLDGTWVDLTLFDNGKKWEGVLVSEERANRYVRSRARRLDERNQAEVGGNTPLLYDNQKAEAPPDPSEGIEQLNESPEKQRFVLNVDARVVRAIFAFLALDEESRNRSIEALQALSVSADAFKIAVGVILEDDQELVVELTEPAPAPEQES